MRGLRAEHGARCAQRLPALARSAWTNRWARGGINTGVGLGMLALLLHSVPLGTVAAHAEPRHVAPVLAIVGLTALSQVVRAGRFTLLLRPLTRVALREALWINLATQLGNYTIPVRAGEALRLWWLTRRRQLPAGAGLGLLVVDHTFDLGGVTAVLSAGTVLKALAVVPALPSMLALLVVLGLALGTLAAIGLAVWLGPRLCASRLARRWLRPAGRERLARHVGAFQEAAGATRGRRRLAVMLGASALAAGVDGLAFAMVFMALGLAVPILSAIIAQVVILYAQLIPSAPGYLGSLEAGGTLLLGSIGLSHGAAAGAIVLWHGLGAVLIVGLGLLGFWRLRRAGPIRLRGHSVPPLPPPPA